MLSRRTAIVCALAVAGTLTLPSAAAAQEPPAGPSRVVVSSRDVRMNLAGVVALRVGCYGRGGDVCIGRLEARLSEPILARRSRARDSGYRIYGPFLLGRQGFSVPSTRGKVVRLQFFPGPATWSAWPAASPSRSPPATRLADAPGCAPSRRSTCTCRRCRRTAERRPPSGHRPVALGSLLLAL